MHPYKDLSYRTESALSVKNVAVLRLLSCAGMLLGFVVTALEAIVYLAEGDPAHPFVSAVGVWTGISIVLAALFALLNSRGWTSYGRTRFMAAGHCAFSLIGAINTLFVFIVRCMNIPVLPLTGYFIGESVEKPDAGSSIPWADLQTLKYMSLVLYIVAFMTMGVSFGVSVAVYKTVTSLAILPANDDIIMQQETVLVSRVSDVDKEKVSQMRDLEATVNGLYRRLDEEDESEN